MPDDPIVPGFLCHVEPRDGYQHVQEDDMVARDVVDVDNHTASHNWGHNFLKDHSCQSHCATDERCDTFHPYDPFDVISDFEITMDVHEANDARYDPNGATYQDHCCHTGHDFFIVHFVITLMGGSLCSSEMELHWQRVSLLTLK